MLLKEYKYELFADYFQFYVEDEEPQGTTETIWHEKKSHEIALGLEAGIIAVGTERNFTVPVSVEIHDSEPQDELSAWDRVNECSLNVSSGTLVILGCTDYRPDAARIQVDPGWYRARIYYGGLDSVIDFDKGDDHYRVALWLAPRSELKILKRRGQ